MIAYAETRNYLILIGVIAAFTALVLVPAQLSSTPKQIQQPTQLDTSAPSDLIDGAKNPELISDGDAFFMFFLTHSVLPNAGDNERTLQQDAIRAAGLATGESNLVAVTLNGFRADYEKVVADYNANATEQNNKGLGYDPSNFLRKRDALVLAARGTLRAGLKADSALMLEGRAQSFKASMKISR
jgi:hypothetical protein